MHEINLVVFVNIGPAGLCGHLKIRKDVHKSLRLLHMFASLSGTFFLNTP